MKNNISIHIITFLLLLAVLVLVAIFSPNTSIQLSLFSTILFSYGYFLLVAKVYKSLQSKKVLRYIIVTLMVLVFLPDFVLTVYISGKAALNIRLHGFSSQLTSYPVPAESEIIDSKFRTYFPGASDSLRGFQALIILKTGQTDEALADHYDVSHFGRAGPRHHRDDLNPYIDLKRESDDIVIIELHDTQSNTSFFSF